MLIILGNLTLLALAIFVLIKSGVFVVRSLSAMARYLGVSEFTISFVLMAFATSFPELAVGLNAALSKSPDLVLGNVIGSNIINLTLILGLIVAVAGQIKLKDHEHFSERRIYNFVLIMAPLVLLIDGTLSQIDGIILLSLFAWDMFRVFNLKEFLNNKKRTPHPSATDETLEEAVEEFEETLGNFFKYLSMFIVSTAILVASSYAIVWSAENISIEIGVPALIIGLFIVGLGTSLPELAFGLRSVKEGTADMSVGGLFGSNALNSTLVLGVTALIYPITVTDGILWTGGIFMAGSILAAFHFLRTKDYLARKEGFVLIVIFIIFIATELMGL